MTTERVTVSLPAEVRQEAQRWADENGVPFSSVVSQALITHLRGLAIDEWLRDYQDRNGAFTEDELQSLARDAGVPYIPPSAAAVAA